MLLKLQHLQDLSSFLIDVCHFLVVRSHEPEVASALYKELLFYYDKFVRPVKNASGAVDVKFGASLIRIIDVDEVHQVMTTSLWMEMQWNDYRFVWDPQLWNGIKKLHIPSDQIWTPDIVLYNNAYGEPHISIVSSALVYYTGAVVWKPPSIYKSFCNISTEYFPYDIQSCVMKFGGWTYTGHLLNVRQLPVNLKDVPEQRIDEDGENYEHLEQGMDLSFYNPSAEWDLLSLTSSRYVKIYPGCCGSDAYIDVRFNLILRRKGLFYTVNLVIPYMLIAILTTFVFYIPPREHKMTYLVQTLVAVTVFLLVLVELIPPSSLAIPQIAKYVFVVTQFHFAFESFNFCCKKFLWINKRKWPKIYRDASSNPVPQWMRVLFLQTLPKYLMIKPPGEDILINGELVFADRTSRCSKKVSRRSSTYFLQTYSGDVRLSQLAQIRGMHPDLIRRMIGNLSFISDQFRAFENDSRVSSEWAYVAVAMDRFWHIIFTAINLLGVVAVFIQSPTFYDSRLPLPSQAPYKPLTAEIARQ
uniref:Neur_chan_LBD domain-containing protein n=1 Tax=Syphacia muris TaxID=451379 RepID=A0A0N5AJ91_9BILA